MTMQGGTDVRAGLERTVPTSSACSGWWRRTAKRYRTDFTVSVDAAKGVSTGISAHDRAETIRLLANPKSPPEDLVQPGHIFPLRAKDGGVLGALVTPKRRSTSPGWRDCNRPACSAKS